MIGRVQEILSNDKMRIAFYLRPRDVGSRIAQHGRRILASMHADVVPVTNIRGKCLVMHRDHLPGGDQEAYRRRPDAFYYNQVSLTFEGAGILRQCVIARHSCMIAIYIAISTSCPQNVSAMRQVCGLRLSRGFV